MKPYKIIKTTESVPFRESGSVQNEVEYVYFDLDVIVDECEYTIFCDSEAFIDSLGEIHYSVFDVNIYHGDDFIHQSITPITDSMLVEMFREVHTS